MVIHSEEYLEMAAEFYQDGGMFYDEATGKLVADYSHMVSNDYDMAGATRALAAFLSAYPEYA